MSIAVEPSKATYSGPSFDRARVWDVMRVGVVTCRPETLLIDVARMMSLYQIHSVVVQDVGEGERPWGIVSSLDIAAAAGSDFSVLTAQDVAQKQLVSVPADASLRDAAKVMSEHAISHLVAVDRATDWPCGVISARGIASALAAPR
ncbi:MAG TPA: CBS domain-containing protein [Solirubrobacterales bacterium]|nr:CBS domain-containing protein [Solirubrobacterales bacterium]